MPLYAILWLSIGWVGGVAGAIISYNEMAPLTNEEALLVGIWFAVGWGLAPLAVPMALLYGIGHLTQWIAKQFE